MNDHSQTSPHVWTRLSATLGSPTTRATLATLRAGVGKEPGTVPALWPFYSTLDKSGALTKELRAEHTAMCLFAVHQQSNVRPVHLRGGLTLGEAMRRYRRQDSNSTPDRDTENTAVDKRMAAIASATTYRELEEHLRRAVSLMRREVIEMDYDRLFHDLKHWQDLRARPAVIRRWGAAYFVPRANTESAQDTSESQKGENNV